jgi:hypothetical protein
MKGFQELPVRVAIATLALLLMTACSSVAPTSSLPSESKTAIDVIQETAVMTSQLDQRTIPLDRALVLKTQESMGTETQSIQADVTEQLRQGIGAGVQINSGRILEDYQDTEQIMLLFPAAPINDLDGLFALTLGPIPSSVPNEPSTLTIRQAWIEQRGDEFVVLAEVKNGPGINQKWAYTRHPDTRQVYLALFDDPNEVFEAEVFHQAPFPSQSTASVPVRGTDWTTVEFNLPPRFVDQSVTIDQCEILLERADAEFNAKTGEFLQWQKDLVTPEAIDRLASELEGRNLLPEGEAFNVTVKHVGQEITRNKRILPFVEHPITLFEKNGSPQAGHFGCSISS